MNVEARLDPKVRERVLALIRDIKAMDPYLRIGQIIENAAKMAQPLSDDAFYIEDDALELGLITFKEHVGKSL